MRFLGALSILLSLASSLAGQEQKLVESIEIRVLNVDVMVSDRNGNPVSGLTREDFELYENGVRQQITNFYEEREAPAPAASLAAGTGAPAERAPAVPEERRGRRVVFFIDNSSTHPFSRNRVLESMRGFVRDSLRPGDEIMISTWNPGIKVELPFTVNLEATGRALERISQQSGGAASLVAQRRETERRIRNELGNIAILGLDHAYSNAITHARFYAESVRNDTRGMASALSGVIATLAGVEGRKALVFSGSSLPLYPGIEMFQFADETFAPFFRGAGPSSRMDAMTRGEGALQESIIRAANANAVTVYVVTGAGSTDEFETPAERQEVRSEEVSFLDFNNNASSFQMIATETGGSAFVSANSFRNAFASIARDFSSYYSLGYRSSSPAATGKRALDVKVKRPGLQARLRRGLLVRSADEEMGDRVVGNIFREVTTSDFRIALVPGRVGRKGRNRSLELEVRIPVEAITLIPQGDELAGGFEVYFGAADAKGNVSPVTRKAQPVRMKAGSEQAGRGRYLTFAIDMLLRKGENIVSVSVVDELSHNTAFAKETVEVR